MSNINPLHPVAGNPTTASVRGNFAVAKTEIEELQAITAEGWQNLTGLIDIAGLSNPPNKVPYKDLFPLNQFDANNINEALISVHIPHDYVNGTPIIPHIHALVSTQSTGVIRWAFDMILSNSFHTDRGIPDADQKFGQVISGFIDQEILSSYQDSQLTIQFGEYNFPAMKEDAVLLIRLYRDATHQNDTYPDPCFLLYGDIYYRSQAFGSIET